MLCVEDDLRVSLAYEVLGGLETTYPRVRMPCNRLRRGKMGWWVSVVQYFLVEHTDVR